MPETADDRREARLDECGSISHATLRSYDLATAFLAALKELHPSRAEEIELSVPLEAWRMERHPYWDEEDASFLINENLYDALNDCAPEGYYFGAHPGDSSDFGFWEVEDDGL